jgi:hypothetical protein
MTVSNSTSNIGPGSYSDSKGFGKGGPGFTFSPKKDNFMKDSSPGPGNYDPTSSITGAHIPSYSIGGKVPRSELVNSRSGNLGPGAYETPLKSGTPSFTIGGRRNQKQDNSSPGPG